MFGISLPEFSLIIIIGILIIPPKDLPKVIRFIAKTYQRLQKMYYRLLRELNILDIDK